ncbi:sigma factor [Streptomyces sp. SID13726]|uniref:sigma factor n=1 Tax=Streptomyces sp. SID13726 TaxID=2706058 RepID=UPI0013BE4FAF|nr:RNA polymerase subunit sigma-70 [Streptomyces sp. SID13726]
MNGTEPLAERFQEHREHLLAVAYRLLGSLSGAEEAVQETWLGLDRDEGERSEDLRAGLTTAVGRICLDRLRSRTSAPEASQGDAFVPDPVIGPLSWTDPEQEAAHADAVGLALLVALEDLEPAERLAFVLHDMFAVPFAAVAPILGRTPAATARLAGRARSRVRGAAPATEPDLGRQRAILEEFLAASKAGDLAALIAVLHPDVVLRADSGVPTGAAASRVVRGAEAVAEQALLFPEFAHSARLARVNGGVGVVNVPEGRPLSVVGVTVTEDRIAALHVLADPDRLARLRLPGTG